MGGDAPAEVSANQRGAGGVAPGLVRVLLLLWLSGTCLRMTILAVPPLITRIHQSLHLAETSIGILTALPILLIAAAAVPGSAVIAHLGPRRTLALGLIVTGLAGAARGLGSSAPVLFLATLIMGCGIAIAQPSLPSVVREWAPARVGIATAFYSNGFLVGELAAAALTLPLVAPWFGGRWQPALAVWSIPPLVTACALIALTPASPERLGPIPQWNPEWRSRRTWSLGLILGCASLGYFGSNAFLPDFLKASHQSGLITPTLTLLNLGQLPSSFVVALWPDIIRHRWPVAVAGALLACGTAGYTFVGAWIVVVAGVVGFATALVFVMVLALPPIIAAADEVHHLSAGMFAIAYTCPIVGSVLGGFSWDATGVAETTFAPLLLAGIVQVILIGTLPLPAVASVPLKRGR